MTPSSIRTRGALAGVIATVVASNFTLADPPTGELVSWGRLSFTPQSLLEYKQVACGGHHTMAVRADGSLAVWGTGDYGMRDVPDAAQVAVRQVAAGEWHCIALRDDGRVICWGDNSDAQSTVPSDLPPAVFIAAGATHSLAVLTGGTVRAWGLGASTFNAPPIDLVGVVNCDGGGNHNTAIRVDGSVACWGQNNWGQTTIPADLPSGTALECGVRHTVLLCADGRVRCWGANNEQQCVVPAGLEGVTAVAAGWENSLALRSDGSVVAWGSVAYQANTPPPTLGPCRAISAGLFYSTVLEIDGGLRGWGYNDQGQAEPPPRLGQLRGVAIGDYPTGQADYVAVRADGSVVVWGEDYGGTDYNPTAVQGEDISEVSAGRDFILARSIDGSIFAWGENGLGQCNVPDQLGPFTMIASGEGHSIAARQGGLGVACWGQNTYGQCSPPPVLTTAPVEIAKVACGQRHSLAIHRQGAGAFSISCWGYNNDGQCTPPADTWGLDAAAGIQHSVAITSSDAVRCWGYNAYGCCAVPAGLGPVSRVAAGLYFTLALRTDGHVVAWGDNGLGQTDVPAELQHVVGIAARGGAAMALVDQSHSVCGSTGGAGLTATLRVSGCRWGDIGVWSWGRGAGSMVPGPGSTVDLGPSGSVGSECDAACETLHAHGGSSVLVPVDLTVPAAGQPDHSIDVSGTANLAGRVWLIGQGASTLPTDLDIPVLRTGNPVGGFDIVQTTVPPPPGYFLTLVPSAGVQGSMLYSLRLLPLQSGQGLAGSNTGSFAGEAVAAEAMDWNGDGFDDLALAVDFGPTQPGQLQVMLNDGAGNLGSTSLLTATPPSPTCLAVGDVNGDGRSDAVVGTASDQLVHIHLNNAPTMSPAFVPGEVLDPQGMPVSVVVMQGPPALQGFGGDIGVGSTGGGGGGGGSENKFTTFNASTGTADETIVLPTTPTTTTTRGGRLATGGASSSSVDGLLPSTPGRVAILEWQQVGTPPAWHLVETQVMGVPGNPVSIDMIDMDGDGRDEIVTANTDPQFQGTGTALPVLTMFRGLSGASSFGDAVPIAPEGASTGMDLSLIDADGDGDRDIVSVQHTLGDQSAATMIRIDTAGPGGAMTIGEQTALDSSHPTLCTRGDLDGRGGEDLFLVDDGGTTLTGGSGGVRVARPFLGDPLEPWTNPADINGDGVVDAIDLSMLLGSWGPCFSLTGGQDCPSDINGDGVVDASDLSSLLANWGASYAVITGVAPQHGSTLGGTLISISGSSLDTTTAVKVGGLACASVQVVSPNLVTAVTPAGAPGDAAIRLFSPNGLTISPIPFSYVLQTIASVSPSQGPTSGGTAITITGTYLNGAISVKVGGVAATSVVAVDANTVTAVTPAGTVGAKTVEVTTPKGTASAPAAFSYVSPSITSVTPNHGASAGGTPITITGAFLSGATSVKVGGVSATGVVVVSATTVTAVTPAGAVGPASVEVTTPMGTATAPTPFTYVLQSITSVTPNAGLTSGGTAITITGTYLNGATSVKIGGVSATSVVAVDASTVTAVTPAGTVGAKTVEVTTPKGTASAPAAFTHVSPPAVPAWASQLDALPDPAVVTNASMRAALIATGLPWRVRDTATQIEMLLVPPGTFEMGCTAPDGAVCAADEEPVHQVTLTNAFYIGRYEVTQAQWLARMGSNPSYYQGASYPDAATRPVELVSWATIQSFLTATAMRLPTEAEWEYAYRAGTATAFHSGPGFPDGTNDGALVGQIAWHTSNAGSQTHVVGGKAGNGLGLHDMAGNVYELVNDWYGAYGAAAATNPTGPATGTSHVRRGAAYSSSSAGLRASLRAITSGTALNNGGFRVVRSTVSPVASGIAPQNGSTLGGTTISISGSNLDTTTSVKVGGVACTSLQVVSPSLVTAVTPAGALGAATVTVVTIDGTATAPTPFTYVNVPTWATLIDGLPDPTVVTNASMRAAITATGLAWRVRDTATQIEMLLVPPGTFDMGCSASDSYPCGGGELPVHEVTFTNAIYIGRYEVTQAQWTARMGSNPSQFQGASYPDAATRPVEKVSRTTIQGFLAAASGLRLPTEAEWEYAYRAGTTTAFHSGPSFPDGTADDTLVGEIAWYTTNSGSQTHVVGGKAANALGLHDMSGNVREWVSDWYGTYGSAAVTNPTGPATGTNGVMRGGSWGTASGPVRSSYRYINTPDYATNTNGFRVARNAN